MTAATLPVPALTRQQRKLLLAALLTAAGALPVAAVDGMRVDCRAEDQCLTDSLGVPITDSRGNRFSTGRNHECDLITGGDRIRLLAWQEGL